MVRHIFLLLGLTTFFMACSEDQPTFIEYKNYNWADIDTDGGSWKPVVLSSVTDITVADPDVSILESEVAKMKLDISAITTEQKEIADYWTNNPVIRWNEIARALAAKYNLAPAPNPDGTYPVPDVANPSTYPLFPFAHPPYSSRAFAYLSVATFDAMITTWHYKYKYARPSIKAIDGGIVQYYGAVDVPSYPSEGASVTAVAQSVLTAMFPLEKDFIDAKAAEHLASLSYTGQALQSDIAAGSLLGADVAKKILTRASTDRMKFAQASKTVADSIKEAAFKRFGWSFQNLDIPERKIGLVAKYGEVKPWLIKDMAIIRPPVPPVPGSAEYKLAEQELIDIANNVTPDQRRIANFWADGTSTYTPPGHWNRIACDNIISASMNPLRAARTLAYLNMSVQDAGIACWDSKYYFHYPRPNQIIPHFKTILGTPNFPGYVSGHSTFSAAAATLLTYIFPQSKDDFYALAKEASESRIYGGIHYRFDCEEGLILGDKIGKMAIELASKDGAK